MQFEEESQSSRTKQFESDLVSSSQRCKRGCAQGKTVAAPDGRLVCRCPGRTGLSGARGPGIVHGPDYVAELRGGTLLFEPRNGPEWSWRLEAVRVGDSPIELDDPTAGLAGLSYDRGALVEEYLPGPSGVEQRFLLREPMGPAGPELELIGSVECEGAFEPAASGWVWASDDGLVSLGDVRVFDADGIELAEDFLFDGEILEYRFDDEVRVADIVVAGGRFQAGDAIRHLLFAQFAAGNAAGE